MSRPHHDDRVPFCGACQRTIKSCDAAWARAVKRDANATPTCERIAMHRLEEDFAAARRAIAVGERAVEKLVRILKRKGIAVDL